MLTRRNFIKYISSSTLVSLFFPVDFSSAQNLSGYKNMFITRFIGLILPIDNKAMLDPQSFKSRLIETSRNNTNAEKVIDYGIKWFDHNAFLLYQKPQYLQLSKTEQFEIINFTVNNTVSLENPDPSKPWTNIKYGKIFFNYIRNFAINEFYTSPEGWNYLSYSGPPQFSGNLDYSNCS